MTTYRLKFNDERLTQKTLTIDNGSLNPTLTKKLTQLLIEQFVVRYLAKQRVVGVYSWRLKGKTIDVAMYKPKVEKQK
jgi:hypothetical protein